MSFYPRKQYLAIPIWTIWWSVYTHVYSQIISKQFEFATMIYVVCAAGAWALHVGALPRNCVNEILYPLVVLQYPLHFSTEQNSRLLFFICMCMWQHQPRWVYPYGIPDNIKASAAHLHARACTGQRCDVRNELASVRGLWWSQTKHASEPTAKQYFHVQHGESDICVVPVVLLSLPTTMLCGFKRNVPNLSWTLSQEREPYSSVCLCECNKGQCCTCCMVSVVNAGVIPSSIPQPQFALSKHVLSTGMVFRRSSKGDAMFGRWFIRLHPWVTVVRHIEQFVDICFFHTLM